MWCKQNFATVNICNYIQTFLETHTYVDVECHWVAEIDRLNIRGQMIWEGRLPLPTATPSKYVTASLLPAVYHPGSANESAAEISLANESEPDT